MVVFFYNCIVCFSVYDVADHCLSFFYNCIVWFFCVFRKTDNTIIKKKTNNGRQHHAQKNRQYNYKKRQTMVGNLIHRKTENTIIKKDKQWSAT
jgi:hypothetical protein